MNGKIFKILEQKEDCVLLVRYCSDMRHIYKVRDIENDDVFISNSYERTKDYFDHFNLAEIRAQKRELFEKWLDEFAEKKAEV